MSMKSIKKSTIVRTILFVVVLINLILKSMGKEVIEVDEGTVYSFIETLVSIAILVLGFWKNNSYTENAKKADKYLEALRDFNEEE